MQKKSIQKILEENYKNINIEKNMGGSSGYPKKIKRKSFSEGKHSGTLV